MRDVSVTYDGGESYVLDDVSLSVQRHEVLGVVGESGSGKSMLAASLLDAVPDPGYLTGDVTYRPAEGEPVEVLELDETGLRSLRWNDVSMVFQGAMSSFNPTMGVRGHFLETLDAHDVPREEGMARARELLADLYLAPERVLDSYPHELSGGMQQRALIALSLVLEPELLVMDEPTAALDLLMQRSILNLLADLREKHDLTMLFITHDLPLIASLADRLAITYAFQPVEIGPTRELVENAAHPYTRALLNATPNLDAPVSEMQPIEGSQPAPSAVPAGCAYHPRCPLADEQCRADEPGATAIADDHQVDCHHWTAAADEIPLTVTPETDESGPQGDETGRQGNKTGRQDDETEGNQ